MKTHMELKLRDRQARTVLVRVEHNDQAINDFLALKYSVVGVGANYLGRDKFMAAERVEGITEYKLAPMLAALSNMADALLDLSCNKVTGEGKRVLPVGNSNGHAMDCECHHCHHGVRVEA